MTGKEADIVKEYLADITPQEIKDHVAADNVSGWLTNWKETFVRELHRAARLEAHTEKIRTAFENNEVHAECEDASVTISLKHLTKQSAFRIEIADEVLPMEDAGADDFVFAIKPATYLKLVRLGMDDLAALLKGLMTLGKREAVLTSDEGRKEDVTGLPVYQ